MVPTQLSTASAFPIDAEANSPGFKIEVAQFRSPLDALLADPEINEIVLHAPDSVWFERGSVWHKAPDVFSDAVAYANFITYLEQRAHIHVDQKHPTADGSFDKVRVHLIAPPLVKGFPHASLRKHREETLKFSDLKVYEWAPPSVMDQLHHVVLNEKANLIFVGPTGVGKTTAISALMGLAPADRTLVIEDAPELTLPADLSVRMLTRPESAAGLPPVSPGDLVRQALRMKPDRLIIGEVRGGEARDLLLAWSTGHGGGMTSLHANHPRQALLRLEMLVQMGAPEWDSRCIQQLINLSLQYLIWCGRHQGKYVLYGFYAMAGLDASGFLIDTLYEHPAAPQSSQRSRQMPQLLNTHF